MADIEEFAKEVATRTMRAQESFRNAFGKQFDLSFTEPVVEAFVNAVFYASMIADEGRYPEVCLMSYRRDSGIDHQFTFSTPLEVSASQIAKLAHAVDYGSHLCVLSDGGKLLLGGIHVNVLDEYRHLGYASNRVANPLKMWIRAPGHIEASCGGHALIYEAGKLEEESPLLFCDAMQELVADVTEELKAHTNGTVESLEEIFNDLTEAIVRLGHGGLLMVTKCPDMREFSSTRTAKSQLLRQILVQYWNDVAALLRAVGGKGNLLAAQGKLATPQFLSVASNTTMLENCVRSIGQLSGMDGAIVMDFECNVVAFNAIIARDPDREDKSRFVNRHGHDIPAEDVARNRGSRHQSAMSYAQRVPNSYAFVVSQDGIVTAFHNRGDGTVLCEQGLRVLS